VPEPSLTRREAPGGPTALVLMLHGGKADGLTEVDERSASWRRARWMMDQTQERFHEAGVSVWLLRYALRGWNARRGTPDAPGSPVPDARWALDAVRAAHGDVPVVLLGHSMGARTAVAVADDANVTGVVALAPWLPPDEPNHRLRERHLVAAHGRSDRITSARQTRRFVAHAESVAASTEFVDMGRVGHYMLRRVQGWNDVAVSRSLGLLRGARPSPDKS
jgi:predicted esterase